MIAVVVYLAIPIAVPTWWLARRPRESHWLAWWEVAISGLVVGFAFIGLIFWATGIWLLADGQLP